MTQGKSTPFWEGVYLLRIRHGDPGGKIIMISDRFGTASLWERRPIPTLPLLPCLGLSLP